MWKFRQAPENSRWLVCSCQWLTALGSHDDRVLPTEAVWKHKNFISISANESIDFLHFLASKIFPAKNDLPLQNGLSRPFET